MALEDSALKSKRQQREKQLRERNKRKDAYTRLLNEQREYEEKYPTFTFTNPDRADPRFVELVKGICNNLDFRTLPPAIANWYARGKKEPGFIRKFLRQGDTHPFVLAYMFHMGEYIYKQMGANVKQWVPFNDIRTVPTGATIEVQFNGLMRDRGPGGTIWHSAWMPKIKYGEIQYTAGFSVHAIEQTMSRLAARTYSYAGAGDIFAYFDQCRYYEPVTLNNGDPAFSIWDQCSRGFFSWNYVTLAYGHEASQNNYYRRVGYCPVVFENGYAKAKTLLPPGYRNTPEEKLLYRLSNKERADMKALVEKPLSEYVDVANGVFVIPDNYFDAIKFFHRFVPQVRQSDVPLFERD